MRAPRFGPSEPRHSYVSVFLLLLVMVVYAIASPETQFARFVLVALQCAVLVVAAWTSGAPRRVQRFAWLISTIAFLTGVALVLGDNADVGKMASIGGLVVAVTPFVMLGGLGRTLREQGVTAQVVFGAVALYLLAGVFFASVYGTLARYGSTPLFDPPNGDGTVTEHYYFSFVTQTTVGYGDFAPYNQVARSAAVLQALSGQLYLVTVLALIVGNLGRGPRTRTTDEG